MIHLLIYQIVVSSFSGFIVRKGTNLNDEHAEKCYFTYFAYSGKWFKMLHIADV